MVLKNPFLHYFGNVYKYIQVIQVFLLFFLGNKTKLCTRKLKDLTLNAFLNKSLLVKLLIS